MPREKTASDSGFTLVELLVALVIITFIMGAVFISLKQTLTGIDHSQEYLDRIRMTDLVLSRMQKEIMSALRPLDDQSFNFVGRDHGQDEQAEDSLQLATSISALSHLFSDGLYQVTYSLRDSSEHEGKKLIWAAAPVRGAELGTTKEFVLGERIQALNFQYYHQNDWTDSFDASSYGYLPQAVKIDLGVLTDKGVYWQRLVVEIPAGGEKTP